MILVTVGTQLAFPRLIDAMDAFAAASGERVVAQTGPDAGGAAGGRLPPPASSPGHTCRAKKGRGEASGRTDAKGRWPHLEVRPRLAPAEFEALFAEARAVVGHAGIGTILSARQHRRPLVVLPRRHALGEHRNDHQMATARAVARLPGIRVAWEAAEIAPLLAGELAPAEPGRAAAHDALIARLRAFIEAR